MRTRPYLRRASAIALAIGMSAAALPASADVPEDGWATLSELGLPEPTPSEQQKSVVAYVPHAPLRYSYERAVTNLETVDTDGADKVISLSADILFAPDKWELPGSASERLKSLLADVPDSVTVRVEGHTDSVDGEVDNQELSENRAGAVANAIEDVRPDLSLEVKGLAATQPKQSESGSDEEAARKANRRVELRYQE